MTQVAVESPNTLERVVKIHIPKEGYLEKINQETKQVAKTAKINGFRPGVYTDAKFKAVSKMYGQQIKARVIDDLIRQSLGKAINDNSLNPAHTPNIEFENKIEDIDNEGLKIVANFEIIPEYNLVELDTISVEKPVAKIADADVSKKLEELRTQHGEKVVVDKASEMEDLVKVKIKAAEGDDNIDDAKEETTTLHLSKDNTFAPGLMEKLLGVKAGQDLEITLDFPADWPAKDVQGKKIRTKMHVLEILVNKPAELNEAFAEKIGVENKDVAKINDKVKQLLQEQFAWVENKITQKNVLNKITEANNPEVPKSLIKNEAERLHKLEHQKQHAANASHDCKQHNLDDYNDTAKSNVANGLILSAYVKKFNFKIDENELRKKLSFIFTGNNANKSMDEVFSTLPKEYKHWVKNIYDDFVFESSIKFVLDKLKVVEKDYSIDELINMDKD